MVWASYCCYKILLNGTYGSFNLILLFLTIPKTICIDMKCRLTLPRIARLSEYIQVISVHAKFSPRGLRRGED